MSYIDFPKPSGDRLLFGAFVVVALDPVASFASLEDPKVKEAAIRVKTRKRLVMVQFSLSQPPETTYFHFFPVGSGLPKDTWACFPVSPETDHPEGRGPIGVSQPLPINHPYIHTTEAFEGIVSRIYTDNPTGIQCSEDDQTQVYREHLRDTARMEAAEYDTSGCEPWTPSLIDEGSFIVDFPETFMRPCYQMWLDISTDETFADPRTHQDEIDALLAIEAEWRERRELECTIQTREDRLLQWRKSDGEYDNWEDDEMAANTLQFARESTPEPPVCATQDGTSSDQRAEERELRSFAYLSNASTALRDASETTCSEPPSARTGKNDKEVSCHSAAQALVTAAYPAPGASTSGPQDSNRSRIADEDDGFEFLAYGRVKSFIVDCFRAFIPAEAR